MPYRSTYEQSEKLKRKLFRPLSTQGIHLWPLHAADDINPRKPPLPLRMTTQQCNGSAVADLQLSVIRCTPFGIADILREDFGVYGLRSYRGPYAYPEARGARANLAYLQRASGVPLDCSLRSEKTQRRLPPESAVVVVSPSQSVSRDSARKLPAWIYCTRYSDRPSSGPRSRRRQAYTQCSSESESKDEKRPRTAFSLNQLEKLKIEFETDRYLTEERRKKLANELDLNDSQIKIWFQNKRAKLKKNHQGSNPLAEQLMADGLYNHSDT